MQIRLFLTPGHPEATTVLTIPTNGVCYGVSLQSPYLVSAGQAFEFGIAARVCNDAHPESGSNLIDARGVVRLYVEPSWEYSAIPSTRTLSDILMDAVQHGVDSPRHGSDCSCMDRLGYEIRRHVFKAIPFDPDPTKEEYDARARVRHILRMALRSV